mgnify:CR=1 FL=1
MKRIFSRLVVSAWLSIFFVAFEATTFGSFEVSRPSNGPVKVHVSIFMIDLD